MKYHTMEVAASPDTITTAPTKFYGFHVETNKTNDVTIVIGDGATEVITYIVTGTTDSYISPILPEGAVFPNGLIVTLTGAASRCTVFYELA